MAAESLHRSTTRAITASLPHFLARFLFGLCAFCLLVLGGTSRFSPQARADTAQATAPAAAAATTAAPLSRQDAEQLLSILNDPKKRQDFTNTLSLMAKGLPVAQPAAPAANAPATPTAVIDSDVHSELDSLTTSLRDYTRNFTGLFKDLRSVGSWFHQQISTQQSRQTLIDAFSRALIILLVALALERAASLLLKKPLAAVTAHAEARERKQDAAMAVESVQDATSSIPSETSTQTRADDQRRRNEIMRYLIRVPYSAMHFLLKLIPVAIFLALGYLGAKFLTTTQQASMVTITLTNAYAIARGLYLLVETALAPRSPAIRLAPARNSTARMLTRWWNVLVAAPSLIICLSSLGSEFDLAPRGTEAIMRAVVLVQHLIIAAFIWRVRHIVANALQPSANMRKKAFWAFVGALARVWWIPVMFLDIALWFVWAAHLKGGYQWILHGTGMTFAILVLSRLLAVLAYGLQDRLFRVSDAMEAEYPGLQQRADYYYPFVRRALTFLIVFTTCVVIAQIWGLPSFQFFFHSALGQRLVGAALSLAIGATIAALAWELINGLLNKQIDRYTSSSQASRATRLRTVLPIIRTVLLTIIIIIVSVTTLSQIGINVTPLLTGAGIMGVGLSFGSQSLVKDVITGFFMLAEDAIQVGDWVTTGGVSGTVEHLSIRTLRVRSIDGDLNIIPFSSVSTIANTGRGFNQIIVKQVLDLTEDTVKVAKLMAGVVAQMRTEEAFRHIIFSDYADLGVDKTDGNGAVLVGAIKTAPMMKWKVQREFYRRLTTVLTDAEVKFYTATSYSTTPPGSVMHLSVNEHTDTPTPPAMQHPVSQPSHGRQKNAALAEKSETGLQKPEDEDSPDAAFGEGPPHA
ncbi:mechanosensitive ion channel [Acetobacter farinalis]|uniref:Mechanosensitive ion channel n=1 Tax=Acetobacter farinalis TaxID=1260984 RepID=A0ABT3Q5G9_9PROT|nr:mechanosensitive ion channel domain-containing protein [Acetobacter farinalis]MCX2560535.1 mechanosensitive ion channel [Acetobacter farinalis]NHO29324.1 mechanosensitive ion channel [Acetobacter farinalis]